MFANRLTSLLGLSGSPRPASSASRPGEDRRVDLHEEYLRLIFRGVPEAKWADTQFLDRLHKYHGPFKSSAALSEQEKMDVDIFFQHREKALTTLTATTSWFGGDYFEFGAIDLNTFRNMLTAFDLCRLPGRYPDTRFYAFDIFGKTSTDNAETAKIIGEFEQRTGYFSRQAPFGDVFQRQLAYLDEHGLLRDQCHLMQGYFQDTMTPEFKRQLNQEGRKIGYAFLDCNWPEQYKFVFEFIFDLMQDVSYIYLDEYFQVTGVTLYFDEFARKMREHRNLGCVYLRNAASFGALFKFYPIIDQPPLDIPPRTVTA